MKRAIGSTKGHSAFSWKGFFAMLTGKEAVKRQHEGETEHYIAVFSQAFKLAKAPYRLCGRIVML